jgi:hypothetical protein
MAPFLAALGVAFARPDAAASNGSKPRIPVVWSDAACATRLDLSSTPTAHFEYAVASDDVGPRTDDEVGDSRTHQFFAFRRLDYAAVGTVQRLPPWISRADIDRAALVDPDVVPSDITAQDVLATTSRFASDEWLRITPDDARVPITAEQAAVGVDWDLAGVEPGTYTVWGYTWEPLGNLWTPRPGFVKVIANPAQADAAGPSIALLDEPAEMIVGEPHALAGCADVPVGSRVTVEWGAIEGTIEPQWEPLIVDAPIDSGPLDLEITLPDDAVSLDFGESRVRLRATATDPAGRKHIAHSSGTHRVRAPEGPAAGGDDDDDAGCTIALRGDRRMAWLVVIVAVLWRRRRGDGRIVDVDRR